LVNAEHHGERERAYLEMMCEQFHALLHRRTGQGRKLVVVDLERTRSDLVECLHDSQVLLHLLKTTQIAIVAIAALVYGNVEFNLCKQSIKTLTNAQKCSHGVHFT